LPAGYLSTKGNQIVDASGNPVRLACAGYMGSDPASDVKGMVKAGFNCTRIAWYNATMQSDFQQIDALVAAAQTVGIKVILDHHGNETPGSNNGWLPYPCNGLPFDSGPGTDNTDGCGDTGTVTVAKYQQDWVTMAARYAGNATVIGVGLQNEPHRTPIAWGPITGSSWGDGSATDIRQIY
jgi:aryl-phospho-beta-D-glucosidase BglC (GH1 family)